MDRATRAYGDELTIIHHEIGMSAPAMSRHLRVLLRAGVVADERRPEDARLRVFRLRPESMVAMQAPASRTRMGHGGAAPTIVH